MNTKLISQSVILTLIFPHLNICESFLPMTTSTNKANNQSPLLLNLLLFYIFERKIRKSALKSQIAKSISCS